MTLAQTLFSFNGRINRAKWWLARLLLIGIMIGVFVVLGVFSDLLFNPLFGNSGMGPMELLIICFYFLAGLAINAKRWHDRDRSAWWILIEFIPILNIWAFVELGCLKGTYGKNRFGPDPLGHL